MDKKLKHLRESNKYDTPGIKVFHPQYRKTG